MCFFLEKDLSSKITPTAKKSETIVLVMVSSKYKFYWIRSVMTQIDTSLCSLKKLDERIKKTQNKRFVSVNVYITSNKEFI